MYVSAHISEISQILRVLLARGMVLAKWNQLLTWFLPTLLGKSYNAFNSTLNSAYDILYGCDISDTISLMVLSIIYIV